MAIILHLVICILITLFHITNGAAADASTDMVENDIITRAGRTREETVRFYAYTDAKHPKKYTEVIINDVKTLEAANFQGHKIIMLCKGWGGMFEQILRIKEAYLSQGILNIVILDYRYLVKSEDSALGFFTTFVGSMQNVTKIGPQGAAFINFLYQNKKIKDGKDVHVLGYSLGAQVGSSIGYTLRKKYGMKVGRLTGLDVAGPFQELTGPHRFDKKNGLFVDSYHTDTGVLGSVKMAAHAEFFINGGKGSDQIGCNDGDFMANSFCAHNSAPGFFIKTITKEMQYVGCRCRPVPGNGISLYCRPKRGEEGKCDDPTIPGQYVPSKARGNFYVKVNEALTIPNHDPQPTPENPYVK